MYFVVFVVFGKLDVSWFMPNTQEIARTFISLWPRMPFFQVQEVPAQGGTNEVIYYTVPTRQLTPQEIAKLEAFRKPAEEKSKDKK